MKEREEREAKRQHALEVKREHAREKEREAEITARIASVVSA